MNPKRPGHAGNIFFALFAGVAMVGLLGVGMNNMIRGPATSAANVTRHNSAENHMIMASRLAVAAAVTQDNSGDCDGDAFVEPLPYRDAGALPHPDGGGLLPSTIGAASMDPWGSEYGYCAFDHGSKSVSDAVPACGTPPRRLQGSPNDDQPVIAVISAGKDRQFQTKCSAYVDTTPADGKPDTELVKKPTGSDDIVTIFTYAEASTFSDGLWKLKGSDIDTAEINKNVEVLGAATIQGPLTLGGGLILPDQNTSGACGEANSQQMRRNTATIPTMLEICEWDGVSGAWNPMNGFDLWTLHNNNADVYRAAGRVGIGTDAPAISLDVVGEIRSRGATGGILSARNPNNEAAMVVLSWLNDVARIRYGGNGAGSAGGFDIQGASDASKLRILNSGNVGIGTTDPQSRLQVCCGATALNLEGSTHVYLSFYPQGFAAGRKGYFGFGSAGATTMQINNDNGPGVEITLRDDGGVTFGGAVTATGAVTLNTAGSTTSHAVRGDRTITAGTGLTGGGDLSANRTIDIATGGITNALLRNSTALSVIGRAANSAGAPADIVAGTDGQLLRRSGTTLGFGALDLANANAVSGLLPPARMGTGTASNSTYLRGDGSWAMIIIPPGGVGNTNLRDSAALSVIGRAANSVGAPADIVAGTNGQLLRRSGTTLGFGALDLANANAVSGILPPARMGSGTANNTTYLRGDGTWAAEADPQVGTLTANLFCQTNAAGTAVDCNDTAATMRTNLGLGSLATLSAETDPKVNATTNGLWCRGTGTQVTCDQAAPTGGDNLGNHTATANIRLGSYYLSGDGGNEGISVNSTGAVTVTGALTLNTAGSTTSHAVRGDRTITAGTGISGGGNLSANRTISLDTAYTDGRYVNATGDTMSGDLNFSSGAVRRIGTTDNYGFYIRSYNTNKIGVLSDDVRILSDLVVAGQSFFDSRAEFNGNIGTPGMSSVSGEARTVCRNTGDMKNLAHNNGACTTSDRRRKKNIQPFDKGLDYVMRLKPVTYEWINQEYEDQKGTKFGLIAQDVLEVFPEIVTGTGNAEKGEWYGVDDYQLPAPIIKSIQELKGEVDTLRAALETPGVAMPASPAAPSAAPAPPSPLGAPWLVWALLGLNAVLIVLTTAALLIRRPVAHG